MREIPPLHTLVLRSVGPTGCHPEVTFGGPHCRVMIPSQDDKDDKDDANNNSNNYNEKEEKDKKADSDDDDDDDNEGDADATKEGDFKSESSPDLVPENGSGSGSASKESNANFSKQNSQESNSKISSNQIEKSQERQAEKKKSAILEARDIMPPDQPTITGRLLRSLRNRPVGDPLSASPASKRSADDITMQSIPLPREPYSGPGRPNANDVDISHPWMLAIYPARAVSHDNNSNSRQSGETQSETTSGPDNADQSTMESTPNDNSQSHIHINTPLQPNEILTIQNTNHALHTLQLFIDALVESGRAGDTRMGIHFFREWTIAVAGDHPDFLELLKEREKEEKERLELKAAEEARSMQTNGTMKDGGSKHDGINNSGTSRGLILRRPSKKRRKLQKKLLPNLPLGTLSLHNLASASIHTFRSMRKAHVGLCLGTLDLTGVHGLTDSILSNVICANGAFPRIRCLSIKNCRKVTGKGIASLTRLVDLRSFDCGGCFNIRPDDVLSLLKSHPGTADRTLNEIYAGGLGWTDVAIESLVELTSTHLRGLGVGFSPYVSGPGLVLALNRAAETLDRLAVPFCDGLDDAVLAALGRGLKKLAVLDVRGCGKVTSLTGVMDARISAGIIKFDAGSDAGDERDEEQMARVIAGHLFVLARYSGITKNSLDETLRLHHQGEVLTCILDGGGIGEGIRR
mmetsp:Transcript_21505/g.44751  ORF Transcript_21505/g.44751 Transcript_21505/m.44751 type:complete len:691 (-) Transcript_21505:191-2263(-)